MDIFTHFMVGAILSVIFLRVFNLSVVIYASIMAAILDFDVVLEPLRKLLKSNLLLHKGISHSFFGGIIFSALAGLIFSLITGESYLLSFIVGFLFYSLHIVLDAIAASKIPLFYPFSKKKFRFFIDRAINFILALFSSSFLVLYTVLFFFLPSLFFSDLIYVIAGFYLIYFSHRFFTKLWFKFRLPKGKMYIPGVNPFLYYIYENTQENETLTFKLSKKTLVMKKNHIIFESKIKEDSLEMQLFESSLVLSKNYLFFTKWEAVVPFIKTQEDSVSITLMLAESYTKNRAYSLKLVFNKKNLKVVNVSEGFLPIAIE